MRTAPYTGNELAAFNIPPTLGALDREISLHRERLQDALDRAGNTHDIEHVRDEITHGKAFLFSTTDSVIVAQVVNYPLKTTLNIWLGAGTIEGITELEAKVCSFGKATGIFDIETRARRGWIHLARKHGYKPLQQIWVKDLRS